MLLSRLDVSKVKVGRQISGFYVAQSDGKRHPDEHHENLRPIRGEIVKVGDDYCVVSVPSNRGYRTYKFSGMVNCEVS